MQSIWLRIPKITKELKNLPLDLEINETNQECQWQQKVSGEWKNRATRVHTALQMKSKYSRNAVYSPI